MIFFALALALPLYSQEKYTLNGYIKDAESGEDLIGATVSIFDINKGTVSNLYGFYSITLEKGTYKFSYTYIGYQSKEIEVLLNKNVRNNIELKPIAIQQDEVEIIVNKTDENVKSTDMGKIELSTIRVKEIPALLGEVDILKTIQLLPGVMSAGEGSSGFYVRGGGSDQNLVLLDEALVFNTGHLFGFFSVFNADAIKSTTLIKGGMPANYGGRLSSVVDVSMKEGNNRTYHATGGIGLISSRLTLEGPLVKNKSSFMLSARRTYIDFLVKPFTRNTDFEGNAYHFFDLNAKANYTFSDKDRLFLSAYFGRDIFTFASPDDDFKVEIPWGNATTTLRWNHLFNDKLFLNTTAIYNDYHFEFDMTSDEFKLGLYSGIKDMSLKMDFGYFPGAVHKVKFGTHYTYHTFIPNSARATSIDGLNIVADDIKKKYAHETAVYLTDNFALNEMIQIDAGLRFSTFLLAPPYTELIHNAQGLVTDTLIYQKGDKVKTWYGLEPRINMRITLNDKSSVKLSYNHNYQYLHLVSNSTSTLPTDIWVPSSKVVKPQVGDQYSIGFFKNFKENMFETSLEFYYKDMRNQIEYKDGYVEDLTRELEWDFVFGRGNSYGMEVFINKSQGTFTGWIGYTLSKTTRDFEDLITSHFPAKFDRTHDVALVGMYELNKRWSFAATFIYGTGNSTTLPSRRYLIENTIVNEYMPRNSYRLEAYHRLDIAATLKSKDRKKFSSDWVFSVYNVYNHKNVYFLYIDTEGNPMDGSLKIQAKKVSLFPIIPSVSWNFKF
ncbi:MAG: TonB-dependent receptor [Bacteroidetes bacterium]|nr:TonB-dependent receptor [Bacteroidota bacterium]